MLSCLPENLLTQIFFLLNYLIFQIINMLWYWVCCCGTHSETFRWLAVNFLCLKQIFFRNFFDIKIARFFFLFSVFRNRTLRHFFSNKFSYRLYRTIWTKIYSKFAVTYLIKRVSSIFLFMEIFEVIIWSSCEIIIFVSRIVLLKLQMYEKCWFLGWIMLKFISINSFRIFKTRVSKFSVSHYIKL